MYYVLCCVRLRQIQLRRVQGRGFLREKHIDSSANVGPHPAGQNTGRRTTPSKNEVIRFVCSFFVGPGDFGRLAFLLEDFLPVNGNNMIHNLTT